MIANICRYFWGKGVQKQPALSKKLTSPFDKYSSLTANFVLNCCI